jgi:hypothetical protein
LKLYNTAPQQLVDELIHLGHKLHLVAPPLSSPSALAIDSQTGQIHAAGDPLSGRSAAAW